MGRLDSKKRGGNRLEIDRVEQSLEIMKGVALIKLSGTVLWEPRIGQIWRLSWREAHGDRAGLIILTRSWPKYCDAVIRVVEEIRRPARKREAAAAAKLRTSASA